MADKVRDLLGREIETLRADVLKAGVLNAKALQDSAESHVAHLHEVLHESSDLQEASFRVVNTVIGFAKLLYSQAPVAESERARLTALAAIDRLAAVMGGCTWREAAAS
ncbi:hypothetical protein [Bosea sp. (in: a-proteobacteria)]|uniref:hypothetical protein n=1 Tax=Bosea sp. (in: a-proteobacteria) TaxID=1871050 RepID=UPI00262C64C0|nr:hypothetical protein [Bosea sp. (in: a-proteobacteria)]MCO5092720.1 hypothetical protein [Bosea sp. (in: a-proteobacteria)]